MASVLLEPLSVPFADDALQVVAMHWSSQKQTIIEVLSRRSGRRAEVHFVDDVGVRVLGELDLSSFWMDQPRDAMKSTWLFVVTSGGWFDLESTRQDFYTKHEAPVTEYLIAGCHECVSVLARTQPVVVEVGRAADV
ncbi:MAG TPA: hypothetical protein VLK85_05585 [Ramlibacter sp.]|nr:hypothetical protein [Ramlibacter sp.]